LSADYESSIGSLKQLPEEYIFLQKTLKMTSVENILTVTGRKITFFLISRAQLTNAFAVFSILVSWHTISFPLFRRLMKTVMPPADKFTVHKGFFVADREFIDGVAFL
jgi:hypothetical protein